MKNFPSKITSFRNSILFDMMIILDNIPMMEIGVKSLHSKSKLDYDDYIKALTYLYALRLVELNNLNFIERC